MPAFITITANGSTPEVSNTNSGTTINLTLPMTRAETITRPAGGPAPCLASVQKLPPSTSTKASGS